MSANTFIINSLLLLALIAVAILHGFNNSRDIASNLNETQPSMQLATNDILPRPLLSELR